MIACAGSARWRGGQKFVTSLLTVACLATASCASKPVQVQGAATSTEPVGHTGRWMTDSAGRVLLFHGVNMVAKRTPYLPSAVGFDADDAEFLAAAGFTAVRLGVIYKAVEPAPGTYDDRYLDRIEQTVDVLARVGIRSLLDFHQDAYNERFRGEGYPDWAVPPQYRAPFRSPRALGHALKTTIDRFWTNAPGPDGVGLQERYANAVAYVAARFATNPDVLGYDLINEPFTGARWPRCASTPVDCAGFDRELGAFQQRVITAIREVDQEHLVWYEPNVLFNWGLPTKLPQFPDARLGMSFHNYCAPAVPCERNAQLRNAQTRAADTGDALMMTEFGGANREDVLGVTAAADAALMSWTVWAYCGCGDPTGSIPPEAEGLVGDPRRPPAGTNIDHTKLRALARPYPRAIAGTPRQLRFNPTTKSFQFVYATDHVDGNGTFDAGACTEVVVPAMQYPKGYTARATGARVVSEPGAGTLLLRATRGAVQITVEVTPALSGPAPRPVHRTPSC